MAVPRPRKPPVKATPQQAVGCIIERAPASLTAKLSVIVPSFDSARSTRSHLYVVNYWMPRGTDLPVRGDRGLLVKDEKDEPWLVAWWPS